MYGNTNLLEMSILHGSKFRWLFQNQIHALLKFLCHFGLISPFCLSLITCFSSISWLFDKSVVFLYLLYKRFAQVRQPISSPYSVDFISLDGLFFSISFPSIDCLLDIFLTPLLSLMQSAGLAERSCWAHYTAGFLATFLDSDCLSFYRLFPIACSQIAAYFEHRPK